MEQLIGVGLINRADKDTPADVVAVAHRHLRYGSTEGWLFTVAGRCHGPAPSGSSSWKVIERDCASGERPATQFLAFVEEPRPVAETDRRMNGCHLGIVPRTALDWNGYRSKGGLPVPAITFDVAASDDRSLTMPPRPRRSRGHPSNLGATC